MRLAQLLCTGLMVLAVVCMRGQHTFNQRFFYSGGPNKPASLFVSDSLIYNYGVYWGERRHLISWVHDFSGLCLDTSLFLGDWGPAPGVFATSDGVAEDEHHIQCGGQVDPEGVVGGFYQIFSSTGEPERFRAFRNPWWSGDPTDLFTSQTIPLDSYLTSEGDVLVSYFGNSGLNNSAFDGGIICFGADDAYRWHLQFTGPWPERIHAITKVGDFFYFALERWVGELVVGSEVEIYKVNINGEVEDEWFEPWAVNVGYLREIVTDGDHLVMVGSCQIEGEVPNAFISKLDTAMNVVWETMIPNTMQYYQRIFEDVTITTDGHYVAAGQYPYLLEEEDPKHGDRMEDVWLAKFNSQTGELMWERFYRIIISTQKDHLIHDLKATPDGGLAFVGESADFTDIIHDDNPLQQGWLVKTDEYGCIVPGCQGVMPEPEDSTEVELPEGEYFRFGPNPLASGQPLNLFNGDIPEGSNYEVHSSDGRLIARINAGYAGLSTQWYLPELAAGSYILSLRHNGRVLQWARLVVG